MSPRRTSKARKPKGRSSRKPVACDDKAWMRWGAIVSVVRKHRGSDVQLGCLQNLVRTLTGEHVPTSVLKDDLRFLAPLVTIWEDFVSPTKGFIDALRDAGIGITVSKDTYYAARQATSPLAKRAVAMHIHKNILTPLDTVLLDAGSACEALAAQMAHGGKGHFTVITNNMRAISKFMYNPSIRVHVTGGRYVLDDESLIGARAKLALANFFVRTAIVGVSGITSTHVYCHGIEGEEELKKEFWQMPAETLVVPATLGKFAGSDACRFGELCKAVPKASGPREAAASLDDLARGAVEQVRQEKHEEVLRASWVPVEFQPPPFRAR